MGTFLNGSIKARTLIKAVKVLVYVEYNQKYRHSMSNWCYRSDALAISACLCASSYCDMVVRS